MKICTYDNPATWHRECWQRGKLICSYSYRLLSPFAEHPIPADRFFFGANIGPWKPGQLIGDAEAMPTTAAGAAREEG
ncbi:MAG: hypothetical protein KDH20_03245 [Rhodocyclaceae bacterium]|nr:hypothetical protein [Rhodocyclaceae bacterium]